MSDTRPLGNLLTYTAKDWVDGESITRAKLQNEFDQIDGLIDQIKQALTDIQSRRSKSGHTPTENTIEGQIVHDADTGLWYGDPDGSGVDDQFATELSAYQADFVNAGTDTFDVGGTWFSNMTENPSSVGGSLAAGAVGSSGAYVSAIGFGTSSISSGQATLTTKIGAVFASGTGTTAGDNEVFSKVYAVRTGATSANGAGVSIMNVDNLGTADFVIVYSSATVDWSSAQTVSAAYTGGTGTKSVEGVISKYNG